MYSDKLLVRRLSSWIQVEVRCVLMATSKLVKISTVDETNPALIYLLTLTTGVSRRAQLSALRHFVRWAIEGETVESFPWGELRHAHVLAYRDYVIERLKPKTTNRYLSAVRGVMRQAWMLGILPANEWARIREIKSIRGSTLPAGRELPDADLRAMLKSANSHARRWFRARDAAMLTLLYASGMRRAEIAGLTLDDVVREGSFVIFKVHGKGHRERLVPVPERFIAPIEQWLVERGTAPGPLFVAERDSLKSITAETITRRVRGHSQKANITNASPHDYRRTYGTRLLDEGADLVAVSKLMGHASISTTAIYDRRGERAKIAAADKLPSGG